MNFCLFQLFFPVFIFVLFPLHCIDLVISFKLFIPSFYFDLIDVFTSSSVISRVHFLPLFLPPKPIYFHFLCTFPCLRLYISIRFSATIYANKGVVFQSLSWAQQLTCWLIIGLHRTKYCSWNWKGQNGTSSAQAMIQMTC